MRSIREVEPFRQGQPAQASYLEAMRRELTSTSLVQGQIYSPGIRAIAPSDYPLRERFFFTNQSGTEILQFSIFSVKRSAVTNVPHGPPVAVEGFYFQHGFIYATNQESTVQPQDGAWAEIVDSLPVLINYDPQWQPAIGHQMGPNEFGQLALNRAGFVVIGEPDVENNRVWVCKSNDQQIRVEVADLVIEPNKRGSVFVLADISQNQDPCDFEYPGDPDTLNVTPPFTLQQVLNLTERPLYVKDIIYAIPVLGFGLVITQGPLQEIARISVKECLKPNDTDVPGKIWRLKGCEWLETDEEILVSDVNNSNMLIPDLEFTWATSRPFCCSDFSGDKPKRRFDIIGSFGLHRSAIAREQGQCNSVMQVEVILRGQNEQNPCTQSEGIYECLNGQYTLTQSCPAPCVPSDWPAGSPCITGVSVPLSVPCKDPTEQEQTPESCDDYFETGCFIQACQKLRCVEVDEEGTIDYYGAAWVFTPNPKNARWSGVLTAPLCPEATTAAIGSLEPLDICTTEEFSSALNLYGLSGLIGDTVFIERGLVACNSPLFVVQVKHQCRDIVVNNVCGGQLVGLRKNECNLELLVQEKVSVMTCIPAPGYVTAIQGVEITVMLDSELSMQSEDLIQNDCENQCKFTCEDGVWVQDTEDPGYQCEENCACEEPAAGLCTEETNGQVYLTPCLDTQEDIECKLRLRKTKRTICVFGIGDEAPIDDDFVVFTLQEIEVDPLLGLSTGYSSGASGETQCDDPFLKLDTRKIKVMVCALQDPLWQTTSTLPLHIQDAFVEASTTTVDGVTCKNLIPETFIVFAPCETLDPEPFICGRPCPIASGGSGE